MIKKQLLSIIDKIKNNEIDSDLAFKDIYNLISGNLGFAEVDMARSVRRGFPEVIFCKNKIDNDIVEIAKKLSMNQLPMLLTKANSNVYNLLNENFKEVKYYERSNLITIGSPLKQIGLVTVVSAGTSDIPIAEEALITAKIMGANVASFWDIGIAGIHRLFSKIDDLKKSKVIVVVAGMDGALPGVVAGLVNCPIIAVPTSIGYGTGSGGFAALLTMLNSCSPGVSVVNIDNGFGAGYSAALINQIGEVNVDN